MHYGGTWARHAAWQAAGRFTCRAGGRPPIGVRQNLVVAGYGGAKSHVVGLPPHLTVGNHGNAGRLFFLDHLSDGLVLAGAQFGFRGPAFAVLVTKLTQPVRASQCSGVVPAHVGQVCFSYSRHLPSSWFVLRDLSA